jgi:hypothetical protein
MTAPSLSFSQQLLRLRPVAGAPVAHGASDHLKRSIGTFQLTMFGVGATVGTGIFFVLSAAVPVYHRRHRGRLIGALLRRNGIGGAGVGVDLLVRLHHPR